MVKGICLRYSKNESEADDFLQDAFIKTFEKLDQFKNVGALGGWIRRVTVTTALGHLRKQKLELSKLTTVMEEIIPDEEGDYLFQKMDLDDLVAKIQNLPSGYRTVFNLYAIEGYTHKEIAENLNISEGTSKSQYSRARNMLMTEIKVEQELAQKKMTYAR